MHLVDSCEDDSFIVAHEVCLSGFDYENLEALFAFAPEATQQLLNATHKKTLVLTMLERHDGKVYNIVKVFHKGRLVHERAKARLFRFADEHKYMSEGSDEAIEMLDLDGVRVALLVCFELRFKELWQKTEGADVIAVPSWWGMLRSEHFASLTQSLAIMNQCYVVASDCANAECTKLSGIIMPQGLVERNGNKPCLELPYEKKEVALMRRYIDVGIK